MENIFVGIFVGIILSIISRHGSEKKRKKEISSIQLTLANEYLKITDHLNKINNFLNITSSILSYHEVDIEKNSEYYLVDAFNYKIHKQNGREEDNIELRRTYVSPKSYDVSMLETSLYMLHDKDNKLYEKVVSIKQGLSSLDYYFFDFMFILPRPNKNREKAFISNKIKIDNEIKNIKELITTTLH